MANKVSRVTSKGLFSTNEIRRSKVKLVLWQMSLVLINLFSDPPPHTAMFLQMALGINNKSARGFPGTRMKHRRVILQVGGYITSPGGVFTRIEKHVCNYRMHAHILAIKLSSLCTRRQNRKTLLEAKLNREQEDARFNCHFILMIVLCTE